MYASVIVPTYNRRRVLERTLGALATQTLEPTAYEVIVVDDWSADDTPGLMEQLQRDLPNVRYVRHHENLGRVVTRNDGITASSGEVLIFLDDDNEPARDFVEAHLSYHRREWPQRIAVMGHVSYEPSLVESSNFARYMNSQYLGHRTPRARAGLDYASLPGHFFGTLNASARRGDVIAVGMFETSLRYYGGEDSFLGHRLRQAGVRLIFGESAITTHHDDVTLDRCRVKYREATREGLRAAHAKDPAFVEATGLKVLMPVDWRRDPLASVLTKLAARATLNPVVMFLLERLASAIDGSPAFFMPRVYRALQAGWYLQGLRSRQEGVGEVRYDPE